MGTITNIDEMMTHLSHVESGGSYKARGPVVNSGEYAGQQAMGRYQVMPGNIPEWSQEALGFSITPDDFYVNPAYQDAIARYMMTKFYNKTHNWDDVAAMWFSGRPLPGNISSDGYNTTYQYVQKVNAAQPSVAEIDSITPAVPIVASIPSVIASSSDPRKVSTTVQGLIVGAAGWVGTHALQVNGVDISGQLQIVFSSLTGVISAVMITWGAGMKLYNLAFKK